MSNLLATAAAQSSLIDGQFVKYEGLLSVISTHAEDTFGVRTTSQALLVPPSTGFPPRVNIFKPSHLKRARSLAA